MKSLIFDVETCGRSLAEIEPLLPPIEPPSNYRDPAKIEAYIAERRAAQIERAALDATLGRVLAVGFLDGDAFDFVGDEDESVLLRSAWEKVTAAFQGGASIVGFRSHAFDLPFLVRRSWALGVAVPGWLPQDGRFRPMVFVDLGEAWALGDRSENISLDRLGRFLGLSPPRQHRLLRSRRGAPSPNSWA